MAEDQSQPAYDPSSQPANPTAAQGGNRPAPLDQNEDGDVNDLETIDVSGLLQPELVKLLSDPGFRSLGLVPAFLSEEAVRAHPCGTSRPGFLPAVVKLKATWKDGTHTKVVEGTGFLIAPRIVLTAGHIVYPVDSHGTATAAKSVRVDFGLESANPVAQTATEVHASAGWTSQNDKDRDYGVVVLGNSAMGFPTLACEAISPPPTSDFISLTGYPSGSTNHPNSQSGTSDRSFDVVPRRPSLIFCNLPACAGQSGSPIFIGHPASRDVVVIGVAIDRAEIPHVPVSGTIATLIDAGFCTDLASWGASCA